MSDLAFLLLIFIMLVSLINYRVQVPIQYAGAETAGRVSAENNLEIWVDRQGGLYLKGIPGALADIERGITQAAPDTLVHIIADRFTPFKNVHKVLDLLQILQHPQVSFVVRND